MIPQPRIGFRIAIGPCLTKTSGSSLGSLGREVEAAGRSLKGRGLARVPAVAATAGEAVATRRIKIQGPKAA
jgi:hypothetical protein